MNKWVRVPEFRKESASQFTLPVQSGNIGKERGRGEAMRP